MSLDRDCRDCTHCGMDMDDFYCGHPKAFAVSCVGVNLSRMRAPNVQYPKPTKLGPDGPIDPAWGLCGPDALLFVPRKA